MKRLLLLVALCGCSDGVSLDTRDPGEPETVQTDTAPAPPLPDSVTIQGAP